MSLSSTAATTLLGLNRANGPAQTTATALPRPATVWLMNTAAAAATMRVSAGTSSLKGGAGLLERPTFDQSQFEPLPQLHEGGDIGNLLDKRGHGSGDSYKVLLIDDARHTEKLVEKALPQIVPSVTAIQARELFHESRKNGVAVVLVTVKEHAEFYAQMMIRSGLRSAIEPDASLV